ncbi:hypothetical protein C2E25_07290 [Geothermobacter hydrogeniphilus]|uniref:Phosphatidic acid phosphatase type 2/haloperoxidase domain-containing protein n=1 Tax=Geothermobacter hydrogeniphilus TaxID=1969733 RepID=A0A2K2HB33_9BACT|nr:undecaprenyl-diphosphatase [Geothermobacter hydrogeniphilus]PNU20515.1 hypothetical protein C2E25_07290 [Geothermobacter hydrogeniphilus]
MEQWNLELFTLIHLGAGQQPLIDGLAIFFAEGGPYLLMFALVVFWVLARDERRAALLEATEAGLLGLLLNQIVGLLIYFPRPYMVGLCTPLITHGPENSFPSDHATLMLSVAFFLLLCRGWRLPGLMLMGMALLTAWGRVYAGIHFPMDMAGSLLVALMVSGIMLWQRRLLAPLNGWLVDLYQQLSRRLPASFRR